MNEYSDHAYSSSVSYIHTVPYIAIPYVRYHFGWMTGRFLAFYKMRCICTNLGVFSYTRLFLKRVYCSVSMVYFIFSLNSIWDNLWFQCITPYLVPYFQTPMPDRWRKKSDRQTTFKVQGSRCAPLLTKISQKKKEKREWFEFFGIVI